MSWPWTVCPITRNSAILGFAAACAMSSSRIPPSPLYVRKTPPVGIERSTLGSGCLRLECGARLAASCAA